MSKEKLLKQIEITKKYVQKAVDYVEIHIFIQKMAITTLEEILLDVKTEQQVNGMMLYSIVMSMVNMLEK